MAKSSVDPIQPSAYTAVAAGPSGAKPLAGSSIAQGTMAVSARTQQGNTAKTSGTKARAKAPMTWVGKSSNVMHAAGGVVRKNRSDRADAENATSDAEDLAHRHTRLNAINDAQSFTGGFRPIDKDEYRASKRTNHRLRAMNREERNVAVRKEVKPFYKMLNQPIFGTKKEVASEAAALQAAASVNAAIGFTPTLLNHVKGLSKTVPGAAGYFVGQLALNAVQPFLNVYIFNSVYSAFDLTRKVGQPGRSGQLEGVAAPRLVEAFEALQVSVNALKTALAEGRAGRTEDGTAMSDLDAMAHVRGPLADTEDKYESRLTAEAFSDSYEVSRLVQSVLSAARQVMYVASGATKFAMTNQAKAGALTFKILAFGSLAAQGLQALVAVAERLGESDRQIKKNTAYTTINSMADVRGMGPLGLGGMIRSPYTQVGWMVNDTMDKPISKRYAELSRQFNVSQTKIRKFDEAGGFNHPKYAQPGAGSAERQQALQDFLASCEGQPIAGCRNAYEELEKKAVLEDITRLLILEDVNKLNVLHALQTLHRPKPAEGAATESYRPSPEEVRGALGLDSDAEAFRLLRGPFPANLVDELAVLREKYDLNPDGSSRDQLEAIRVRLNMPSRQHARLLMDPVQGPAIQAEMGDAVPAELAAEIDNIRAGFDAEAQERHDAVLDRVRITLKLDSADDAAELLEGPDEYAKGAMSRPRRNDLAQLTAKYGADGPFHLLRGTLGLASLDEAKALRQGLTPALDGILTQLHDKYETRKSLRPQDIRTMSRAETQELVEAMQASNVADAAMSSVRGMVIGMLFPKYLTSSLNAGKWHVPQQTGHPEGDRARIEKSLTPFEHTLLQVALAMPKALMNFKAKPPAPHMEQLRNEDDTPKVTSDGRPVMRPVANTKALNEGHPQSNTRAMPEPASMDETRRILKLLTGHKLDKMTVNWDPTDVSKPVQDRMLNVMDSQQGAVQKVVQFAKNTAVVNWDRKAMPGYLTPPIAAQWSRQTFLGVGGTIAFFLVGSLIGLISVAETKKGKFKVDPHTGAPNQAKHEFDQVTFAIQATLSLAAIYAALNSGAFSIFTSNLRGKDYFLRADGRPTFFQMMREKYAYGANLKNLPWKSGSGAVTDHVQQAWPGGKGRQLRNEAEALIAEAHAWMDRKAAPFLDANVIELEELPPVASMVQSTGQAGPSRTTQDNDFVISRA